jgi:hypothetical protein
MSKHKSRIRIVREQRMKLSMRHRILIGSSVAVCLTFLIGVTINISDSEKAVAGNKIEMITAKPVIEKSGASITMKRPYPNPFVGFFHFDFTTTTAFKGELNLLNSAGQEIKKINVQAEPGLNSIEVVNDCDMKPGIYYAILTTNNKKYVQRLEKN